MDRRIRLILQLYRVTGHLRRFSTNTFKYYIFRGEDSVYTVYGDHHLEVGIDEFHIERPIAWAIRHNSTSREVYYKRMLR